MRTQMQAIRFILFAWLAILAYGCASRGAAPPTEQPQPEPTDWRTILCRCDRMQYGTVAYSVRFWRDGRYRGMTSAGTVYVGKWHVQPSQIVVFEKLELDEGEPSSMWCIPLLYRRDVLGGTAGGFGITLWRSK